MNLKLILFDLDGTLIDTKPDIIPQVQRALRLEGHGPSTAESIGPLIGRGSKHLFRQLLGPEAPEERVLSAMERFRELYLRHIADHSRPYPGIVEALDHFADRPKAIVTNKGQIFSDALLDALDMRRHFKAVYGFEAFAKQKPDPDPIIGACKAFSVSPENTAFIGDSRFDVQASRAAGTFTVGALWGYEYPLFLCSLLPNRVIETPQDLIGALSLSTSGDASRSERGPIRREGARPSFPA